MSASSTPTRRPSAWSPSARLAAVVDLPTPPLPDATAMMALTPGTPATRGVAACGVAGRGRPGHRGRRRPPGARRTVRRERDHDGFDAGQLLHDLFGRLAHGLEAL